MTFLPSLSVTFDRCGGGAAPRATVADPKHRDGHSYRHAAKIKALLGSLKLFYFTIADQISRYAALNLRLGFSYARQIL
jgi:hypothetical protein